MQIDAPTKAKSYANTNDLSSLKVIRRNKTITNFNRFKIVTAIKKGLLDPNLKSENKANIDISNRVNDIAEKLTNEVSKVLERYLNLSATVSIEDIQDQIELAFMRNGYSQVAKSYILYRERRAAIRKQSIEKNKQYENNNDYNITITLDSGEKVKLDINKINAIVEESCKGIDNVTYAPIVDETIKNLFEGVSISDVRQTLIMSARTLIESEPNYNLVAARLLLQNLRLELAKLLHIPTTNTHAEFIEYYPLAFKTSIEHGVKVNRLDKKLLTQFDLNKLSEAILPDRDLQFTYLSMQTLYDRYFLHDNDIRYELPQIFFMRVAMGLAISEENKTEKAIEFYLLLSSFDFMSSTPTLFNSGTVRSQLSSCFLTTIEDDLAHIYKCIGDNAQLQKFAGGVGNDWTNVRAMGSMIKGTNGKSQGSIPFLKVANDTAVAVNQGGKRKGAVCAYLEVWHADIEDFLELRKNTGEERRRTHDMNTAVWVPDLFMERVMNKEDWTLFSPEEVPELHDLYGRAFAEKFIQYEEMAKDGKIKIFRKIPAVNLWRKMLGMLFETGHPWITFKDVCNLRSPQQHAGVIHSSNLCTEITLNTSAEETAVCNLGSINLSQHTNKDLKNKTFGIDIEKLEKTVKTAIRMLDNVIDINYYSIPEARRSNLKHRPIGLGLMGFQDALYQLDISYQSKEAIEFADKSMEYISYFAISASVELAKERGAYQSFENSLWSRGILPIDSIKMVEENRDIKLEQDTSYSLDWDSLREKVKSIGMRNSNVMAIAPTATISNICGVSQSIEPTYQNLFVKSNLSGEFTVVNKYLVSDLKKLNLWDQVMVNDLKYFSGSIKDIDRIPQNIKDKYATSFEIDPLFLLQAASRRQKWIDQAQSLNLYVAKPSGKTLDTIYKTAWILGLKTTYYMRSLGATDTEKSTLNRSNLNAVQVNANVCPIDDPSCEACQ